MPHFFGTGHSLARALTAIHKPIKASCLACLVSFALALPLAAQTCDTNSTIAALVSGSGFAEKIGDVVLTCTGGAAGSGARAQIFIGLNTNITNRLDANGRPANIVVSSSGAAVTSDPPVLVSPTTIEIFNLNYAIPTPSSLPVTIRIGGIRAAAATLGNGTPPTPVTASIVAGGINLPGGQSVTAAIVTRTLLASVLNGGIPCSGQFPATYDLPGFIAAATTSSVIRVTEGAPNAFAAKDASSDSGTRILVKMSGYGTGVRLFVPDALAGNSGVAATSAGQFASSASGGTYSPGKQQLLLSRVSGADANGNGGTLVSALPAATTSFTAATELTLSGGNAFAVYEVIDSNAAVSESVQVPVFVIPVTGCGNSPDTSLSVSAAPISTVSVATATDPVPRYSADFLTSDCQLTGDCNAGYFPVLSVDKTPVNLTGASLGATATGSIQVANNGGSQLNFATSVTYQSGSNWLSVTPPVSSDNTSLALRADPSKLQPGTYQATVTINGGAAGTAVVPVTFAVGPAGVTIQATVNAASFTPGAIAPGSYVALFGVNLAGSRVGVTFNGLPASIAYDSAGQINAIVPPSLAGQAGAAVIATVDDKSSPPFVVALSANAPGIFNPGIVNPDLSTVNSASKPAARGGIIQIYLTGLAIPVGGLTVTMGNQTGLVPLFAGAQPTYAGLDQVNIAIPSNLSAPNGVVPVSVCVPGASGPVCSNSINLYVQ